MPHFIDKNEEDRLYRLNIKYEDGTKWVGNWYLNKILCYLEAIFSIDGTFDDIDLKIYDVDQDEEENK